MFLFILFVSFGFSFGSLNSDPQVPAHILAGILAVLEEPEDMDHNISGVLSVIEAPEPIEQVETNLTRIRAEIESLKLESAIRKHVYEIFQDVKESHSASKPADCEHISPGKFAAIKIEFADIIYRLKSADSIDSAMAIRSDFETYLNSLRVDPRILCKASTTVLRRQNADHHMYTKYAIKKLRGDILALEKTEQDIRRKRGVRAL